MRTAFVSLTFLTLGVALFAGGCKNTCSETDKGSQCTSKSVTNFVGTPVDQDLDYAGGDLTVDSVYGNVTIQEGGVAGKVHVTFQPFDYEGYDEKDLATRQMNTDLDLNTNLTGGVNVTTGRHDSTNGLGANISITIPNDFSGIINVHNRGSGPLGGKNHEFDVSVLGVGQATSVTVNNDSDLGDTDVEGKPSVTSTTVNAHEAVTVKNVADNVNISTDGTGLGDPGVILSIASISAGAAGGTITSQEGGITATFPATGNYSIQASAPNGAVTEGTVPSGCNVQTAAATAKTVTCGATLGPNYKLTTNGKNDDVFREGDILLSYK